MIIVKEGIIVADKQLQDIEAYLKPSSGSMIFMTLAVLLPVGGFIVSGSGVGLIFAGVYVILLICMLISHNHASERSSEQPLIYAQKYGADVLCKDFQNAISGTRGDDFRIGNQFLYSKRASRILAFSEIASVSVSFSRNVDSADDYDTICRLKDHSSVTISSHERNTEYVSMIETRIANSNETAEPGQKGRLSLPAELLSQPLSPTARDTIMYALRFSTYQGMIGHLYYIRDQLAPEEQKTLNACLLTDDPRAALTRWVCPPPNTFPADKRTPSPLASSDAYNINPPARMYSQEELDMLHSLYQEGTITEEEYQQCIAGQ